MPSLIPVPGPAHAPGKLPLVFSHANGYPPESYSILLTSLAQHYPVYTFAHRPLWGVQSAPSFLSWQRYADDLAATLSQSSLSHVCLIGHSMGGVVSMLTALQQPQVVSALIAMDPVLLTFTRWALLRLQIKVLKRDTVIITRTLGRPRQFENHDAAFAFYRPKRAFSRMGDQSLRNYVQAGHVTSDQGDVSLLWTPEWEACVYRSVPFIFHRLKRLSLPMLGLVGENTDVLEASALDRWQAVVPQLQLRLLKGGHLLPLENPEGCLEQIQPFLTSL